ncbi:hypothetical protein BSQ39_08285 [Loigolactobacillus backii]|uniref:exodeoxyribonuclease X C-terminal domain-containing protein n=1 Tax=Loigolactobacillus backii TaxID=375175 RepID=UPI000C1CA752|nr:hypothetical protein [Loigolactobacillus backii]PIO83561.1 hypothetical protein BSQ39_08285 [Loigolactobacillus backii]
MSEALAPQSAGNASINVISELNLQAVNQQLQSINQFQAIVKQTLQKDQDYGVIPGTNKPTLLKPGAEKLLMILGMTSEYEIIEKVMDYDEGFFSYTVKSMLYKEGQLITEGFGSANTRETRYRQNTYDSNHKKSWDGTSYQDPYTLNNTVLKMAKKRAQVDATLTVASLSNVFTQDIEDMGNFSRQETTETMNNGDAASKKLTFGKHKGETFGELVKSDRSYVEWLMQNARDGADRKAAKVVLDGDDKPTGDQAKPQQQQSQAKQTDPKSNTPSTQAPASSADKSLEDNMPPMGD